VGHPLHRGRMTDVESHKGAALASRFAIRFFVVTEERSEVERGFANNPALSTLDVIASSHPPALGPSDIPLCRLHQQGKYRGDKLSSSNEWCLGRQVTKKANPNSTSVLYIIRTSRQGENLKTQHIVANSCSCL